MCVIIMPMHNLHDFNYQFDAICNKQANILWFSNVIKAKRVKNLDKKEGFEAKFVISGGPKVFLGVRAVFIENMNACLCVHENSFFFHEFAKRLPCASLIISMLKSFLFKNVRLRRQTWYWLQFSLWAQNATFQQKNGFWVSVLINLRISYVRFHQAHASPQCFQLSFWWNLQQASKYSLICKYYQSQKSKKSW